MWQAKNSILFENYTVQNIYDIIEKLRDAQNKNLLTPDTTDYLVDLAKTRREDIRQEGLKGQGITTEDTVKVMAQNMEMWEHDIVILSDLAAKYSLTKAQIKLLYDEYYTRILKNPGVMNLHP